jgi:hypothetical protein
MKTILTYIRVTPPSAKKRKSVVTGTSNNRGATSMPTVASRFEPPWTKLAATNCSQPRENKAFYYGSPPSLTTCGLGRGRAGRKKEKRLGRLAEIHVLYKSWSWAGISSSQTFHVPFATHCQSWGSSLAGASWNCWQFFFPQWSTINEESINRRVCVQGCVFFFFFFCFTLSCDSSNCDAVSSSESGTDIDARYLVSSWRAYVSSGKPDRTNHSSSIL